MEANPERWIIVSPDTVKTWHFLADGLEAGYVWDDHLVSVGSKQVRKPKKDGWYEHGQNCLEYLELNFGGVRPSEQQVLRTRQRIASQQLKAAQRDTDPFKWQRQAQSRGGYR